MTLRTILKEASKSTHLKYRIVQYCKDDKSTRARLIFFIVARRKGFTSRQIGKFCRCTGANVLMRTNAALNNFEKFEKEFELADLITDKLN